MHESTMQSSSPMLCVDSSFSTLTQKESECLDELCENIQKDDGFRDGFGEKNGCNEESLDAEVKTETDRAELSMDNGFQEKLEKGKLEEKEKQNGDDDDQKEGNEFEFPLIARNSGSSPAPADEIFHNGRILPVYSVSGNYSELSRRTVINKSTETTPSETVRLPLKLLFLEDREPPSSSCSSSEADELDGVAPGTYCVWEPKTPAAAEGVEGGKCKKSHSTGSSKRLKFRNFLNRSSSDSARDRVVFSPSNESNSKRKDEKLENPGEGRRKVTADLSVKSGGEKRRQSLLPYRRDMVGFFGNANDETQLLPLPSPHHTLTGSGSHPVVGRLFPLFISDLAISSA